MPTEEVKLIKNSLAQRLSGLSSNPGHGVFNTYGSPTDSQYLGEATVFPSQDETQEENFATVQPTIDKIGNAFAKIGIGTFAVAGQGVGSLLGIGSALYHWDISEVNNNPVSKFFNEIKDWQDENFVQYATSKERESWTRFIPFGTGSSSFYFGTLADGAAYVLGSYIPGIGAGKLVGLLGGALEKGLMGGAKLAGYVDEAAMVASKAEPLAYSTLTGTQIEGIAANSKYIAEGMAKASKFVGKYNAGVTDVSIDLLAAHNEAVMEASEGRKKYVNDRIREYIRTYGHEPQEQDLLKIEEESKSLFATRYMINLPIIAGSNILQFGNAFKGKTASTISRFEKAKRWLAGDAEKGFTVNAPKFNKYTAWSKNILTEFSQEGAQFTTEKALDEYYKDRYYNPEKANLLASFTKAVKTTFTTAEGWDNMMAGAFLGGIGKGGFRSTTEEERAGKTGIMSKFKFDIYSTGVGSPYEEINRKTKDAGDLASFLNARDKHLDTLIKGLASNKASENKMMEILASADPFNLQRALKDEDHAQVLNTILTAFETGQTEWLINNIKESAKKYTKDQEGIDEYKERYAVAGEKLDPDKEDVQVINEKATKIVSLIKQIENHYKDINILFPNLEDNQKRDYVYLLNTAENRKQRLLSIYEDIRKKSNGIIDPMAIRMTNSPAEYHSALKKAYADNEDALERGLSSLDFKNLSILLNDAFMVEQSYEVYKTASDMVVNIKSDYIKTIEDKYKESALKNYERVHEISRIAELKDKNVTHRGKDTSMMAMFANYAGTIIEGNNGKKHRFKKDSDGKYDPNIIVDEEGSEYDSTDFFNEKGNKDSPKFKSAQTETSLKNTQEIIPKLVFEIKNARIKTEEIIDDLITQEGHSLSSALINIKTNSEGKIINHYEIVIALAQSEVFLDTLKNLLDDTYKIIDELSKVLYKDLLENTVNNPLYSSYIEKELNEKFTEKENYKQSIDFVQSIIDSVEAIKKALADGEPELTLREKIKEYNRLIRNPDSIYFNRAFKKNVHNENNYAIVDIEFVSDNIKDNVGKVVSFKGNMGVLSVNDSGKYILKVLDSNEEIIVTDRDYEGTASSAGLLPVIGTKVKPNAKTVLSLAAVADENESKIKDSFANFLNIKLTNNNKIILIAGTQFKFDSTIVLDENGSFIENTITDTEGNRIQAPKEISAILAAQRVIEDHLKNVTVTIKTKIGNKSVVSLFNNQQHRILYKGKIYELDITPLYDDNKDFVGVTEVKLRLIKSANSGTEESIYLDFENEEDAVYIEAINDAYSQYDSKMRDAVNDIENFLNLNSYEHTSETTIFQDGRYVSSGIVRSFDKNTKKTESREIEISPGRKFSSKEAKLLKSALSKNLFYLRDFKTKVQQLEEYGKKAVTRVDDPTTIPDKHKQKYTLKAKHSINDMPYVLTGKDSGDTLDSKIYYHVVNNYNVKKDTIIINDKEIKVEWIVINDKVEIPESIKSRIKFINGRRGPNDIDLKVIAIHKRENEDDPIEPVLIEDHTIHTSLPYMSLDKDADGNYLGTLNKYDRDERFHFSGWSGNDRWEELNDKPSLTDEEKIEFDKLDKERDEIIVETIKKLTAIREKVLSSKEPLSLYITGKTPGVINNVDSDSPYTSSAKDAFLADIEKEIFKNALSGYDPKNKTQEELLKRIKFWVGDESETQNIAGTLVKLNRGSVMVEDTEKNNLFNVTDRKLRHNEANDLYTIIAKLSEAKIKWSGQSEEYKRKNPKPGEIIVNNRKFNLSYAGGFYIFNFDNFKSFDDYKYGIRVLEDGTLEMRINGETITYTPAEIKLKSAEILNNLSKYRRSYDKEMMQGSLTKRKSPYVATIINGEYRYFTSFNAYRYHLLFEKVGDHPPIMLYARSYSNNISQSHSERQFINKNLLYSIKSKKEQEQRNKELAEKGFVHNQNKKKVEKTTKTAGGKSTIENKKRSGKKLNIITIDSLDKNPEIVEKLNEYIANDKELNSIISKKEEGRKDKYSLQGKLQYLYAPLRERKIAAIEAEGLEADEVDYWKLIDEEEEKGVNAGKSEFLAPDLVNKLREKALEYLLIEAGISDQEQEEEEAAFEEEDDNDNKDEEQEQDEQEEEDSETSTLKTTEEFKELSASEQKAYLEKLGLKQKNKNWSNATQRTEVYNNYLKDQKEVAGLSRGDVENKKAFIERRRQEEIDKIIKSIFPNTKLSQVVYHGTRTQEKFDTFDETKIGELDSGYFGRGFYFSPDITYAEGYSKQYNGYTIAAVLNLQNPLETDANKANTNISLENNDGAIVRVGENLTPELNNSEYDANEIGEVVVKNSNQIHILSKEELDNITKINAKYDAELKALEQQPTTSNQSEIEAKIADIESKTKEELDNVKPVYHHTQVKPEEFNFSSFQRGSQSISQFGDGLNASSNTTSFLVNRYGKPIQGEVNDKEFVEIDANKTEKEIYEYLKAKGYKFSQPASEYISNEKANDQPAIIELFQDFQKSNPGVKGVKISNHIIGGQKIAPFYVIYDTKSFYGKNSLVNKINAKYDAEYVDAVKKGEMTKEQAMQALEQAGRKGSDAYTELAALEGAKPAETTPISDKKADIERRRQRKDNKIENIVYNNGVFEGSFLDNYEFIAEGSESRVYRSKDGTHVIKISEPYNSKDENLFNSRIINNLIREILGSSGLEVIGYYEHNGVKNPVYKQHYIEGKTLSEKEVASYLKTIKGVIEIDGKFYYKYDNKLYAISDFSDNVIQDKNGNIVPIDLDIYEVTDAKTIAKYDAKLAELEKDPSLSPNIEPTGRGGEASDVGGDKKADKKIVIDESKNNGKSKNNKEASFMSQNAYHFATFPQITDINEELDNIQDILGMSDDEKARLAAIVYNNSEGLFKSNGDILLKQTGVIGRGYHEAFHKVFRMYMTDEESESLLNKIKEKYPYYDDQAAEERLAEEFRYYMIKGHINPELTEAKNFIEALYNFIMKFLGLDIESRFRKIKKGGYASLHPVTNRFSDLKYGVKMEGKTIAEIVPEEIIIDEFSDLVITQISSFTNANILTLAKELEKDDTKISEVVKRLINMAYKDKEYLATELGKQNHRHLFNSPLFNNAVLDRVLEKLGKFVDFDLEEEEKDRYDEVSRTSSTEFKKSYEENNKSLVPAVVKLMLYTITDEYKSNVLGLKKPISVPAVLRDLTNAFANISSETLMKDKIRKLADKNFIYYALIDKLGLDRNTNDLSVDRYALQRQFFGFLRKTKHDMIAHKSDGTIIKLQNTQILNNAKAEWMLNLKRMKKDIGGFINKSSFIGWDKVDKMTYMSAGDAKQFAESIGIMLEPQMYKSSLEREQTDRDLITVHAHLSARKEDNIAIDSIFKTKYKNATEAQKALHKALESLAVRNSKYATDIISNALTSPAGTPIYNITQPNSFTEVLAEGRKGNFFSETSHFKLKDMKSTPNMGLIDSFENTESLKSGEYIRLYFRDALKDAFHFFTPGGNSFEHGYSFKARLKGSGITGTSIDRVPDDIETLVEFILKDYIPTELGYLYLQASKEVTGYFGNKYALADKYENAPDINNYYRKSLFYPFFKNVTDKELADTGPSMIRGHRTMIEGKNNNNGALEAESGFYYDREKNNFTRILREFIDNSVFEAVDRGAVSGNFTVEDLEAAIIKQLAMNIDMARHVFDHISTYGTNEFTFFKRVKMAVGPKEYYTPDGEFMDRNLPRNDSKPAGKRTNLALLYITEPVKQSVTDEVLEFLEKTFGKEKAAKFTRTEYADGSIILNLEGYRDLMATWGNWYQEDEDNYLNDAPVEVNSQKPQFFANNADGVPFSAKCSAMPTIREQFEEGSIGRQVLDLLFEKKLDGIIVPSAVKNSKLKNPHELFIYETNPATGKSNVRLNTNISDLSVVEFPLADFGRQSVSDPKEGSKIMYSVQMNKMITVGLYNSGEIDQKSWHSYDILGDKALAITEPEEAQKHIKSLVNSLNFYTRQQLDLRYYSLLQSLGLEDNDGIITTDKIGFENLKKTILEAASKNSVSDNVKANIEIIFSDANIAKYEFSISRDTVEHLINSTVRKTVVARTLKGRQGILGTSLMLNNLRKFTQDDIDNGLEELAPYRPNKEGKYTEPLELYLPHYFKEHFEDADIDFNNIDPRLLRIIATRIPCQALSSIESVKVKGFLPPSMGDIVITPAVMVTKSGHDFDIDKLNMYFFNSYKDVDKMIVPFVKTTDLDHAFNQLIRSERTLRALMVRHEELNTVIKNILHFRDEILKAGKKRDGLRDKIKEAKANDKDITALDKQKEELSIVINDAQNSLEASYEALKTAVADMPLKDYTPLEVYENEMLNIQHEILMNEANFPVMMTPNSQDLIDAAAEKYKHIHHNPLKESKYGYLKHFGPMNHIIYALTNRAAMSLIAIAAKASTAHSMTQILGIELNNRLPVVQKYTNGKSFGGKYVKNADGSKNSDITISNVLEQIESALVDAEKGDAIINVNLNKQTINPLLLLLSNGVHPENIFAFINNKHYVEAIKEWESAVSTGDTKYGFAKYLEEEAEKASPFELDFAKLDKYDKSQMYWIIHELLKYQSEQISLSTYLSPDTVKFNNQDGLYYFLKNFDDFKKNSEYFNTSTLAKIETDMSVSPFYTYLRSWNRINTHFSLFNNPKFGASVVRNLKDYIYEDLLKYRNERAKKRAMKKVDNALLTAILQNYGRAPIYNIDNLFKGNNSVPMRFYELIKDDDRLLAYFGIMNGKFKDNLVILANRPTVDEANEIANLLQAKLITNPKLADDVLDFLAIQSGVQPSPINFINYFDSVKTVNYSINAVNGYLKDPGTVLKTFFANFFLNVTNDRSLVKIHKRDYIPDNLMAFKDNEDTNYTFLRIGGRMLKLPDRNDTIYSTFYHPDLDVVSPLIEGVENIKKDISKSSLKADMILPISEKRTEDSNEDEDEDEDTSVKGVEISSNARGLAAALTNPTHYNPKGKSAKEKGNLDSKYSYLDKGLNFEGNPLGRPYKDVEEAYHHLKSNYTRDEGPNSSYHLMVKLIKAKLEQYPRLAEEITEQGGSQWILSSTHRPVGNKSVWETGGKNWFIKALNEAYLSQQPTSKGIEITKTNYTRQEVQNNPNTAYVFTENTYSITAFPNKQGGGSAIIRPEPNAFAIVTKKKYDYNTKENVDYTDTPEDFKEFTEVNTRLINELKNSGKSKIVFPQGFATDKAKMPTRFAEWLQKELLNNFGLVTELNSTKTGLISKSIQQPTSVSKTTQPTEIEITTEPILIKKDDKSSWKIVNKDGVLYNANTNKPLDAKLDERLINKYEVKEAALNGRMVKFPFNKIQYAAIVNYKGDFKIVSLAEKSLGNEVFRPGTTMYNNIIDNNNNIAELISKHCK